MSGNVCMYCGKKSQYKFCSKSHEIAFELDRIKKLEKGAIIDYVGQITTGSKFSDNPDHKEQTLGWVAFNHSSTEYAHLIGKIVKVKVIVEVYEPPQEIE